MDDWYHSHYHSLILELDDNLIGLTIAMVTWLVGWLASTCKIMTTSGLDNSRWNYSIKRTLLETTDSHDNQKSAKWGNWFIS